MAKPMLTGADMNNQRVQNVGAPSSANDATTKTYVDNLIEGLSFKDEVKAATTAALPSVTYANGTSGVGATLTATANGAMAAVDSETAPALNDRYLIKDQSAQLQNGIYIVSQVGTGGTPFILTRAIDANITTELNNATVSVTNGTVNGGKRYVQATKNPVIGTDILVFALDAAGVVYTASTGVTKVGNDFQLASSAAGTGLVYTTGVLSVDRTKVPNVFNVDIGDGSTLALPVTHNLNTKSVTYTIRRKSDDVYVDADAVATSVNVLTITFATAPTTNQYNVTVSG